MRVIGRPVASSAVLLLAIVLSGPHHVIASDSTLAGPLPLIIEFYPCGVCDDEYVVVSNPSPEPLDLAGWAISDGEGSIAFVGGVFIEGGGRAAVSANSSSFAAAYGRFPEVALDGSGEHAVVVGTFRMGDTGDDIRLISPDGSVVDSVRYGASEAVVEGWVGPPVPSIRQGEVARRSIVDGLPLDTDSANDWTGFREYRYGYTVFGGVGARVEGGAVTVFCNPDNSLSTILSVLDGAAESVRVCSYELSSVPLVRSLCEASLRGVQVRVLVDGSPVGGMEAVQSTCLSVLSLAGAEVSCIQGTLSEGIVRHFGAMHAKYIVVDSRVSVVLSENLVESGISQDTVHGNRGWGAAVDSADLSCALETLFDDDSRSSRRDVVAWTGDSRFDPSARLPDGPEPESSVALVEAFTTESPSYVSLMASPDCSESEPFLCPVLMEAKSLVVQQFQVDLEWYDRWHGCERPSPVLEAMLSSLRSGGTVRMSMDSSWFNEERNDEVRAAMVAVCTYEGLSGEFHLSDPRSPITLTHNKGLVVDGSLSFITSDNWVNSSFSRNREMAMSIASEEVASYLTRVFDFDWYPDESPPIAVVEGPSEVSSGDIVVLNAERSSDDRLIQRFDWDVDGDGRFDCTGPVCEFVASLPVQQRVVLKVVDSWGNEGTVEFVVSVRADWVPVAAPPSGSGPLAALGAAACTISVWSLLILVHRRRR